MEEEEKKTEEIPEKEEGGVRVNLYYWLQALVVVMVTLIVVFTFFGRIIGVVGHSMDPTLADGEILLLQSIGYTPEQGDIVVLNDYAASVLEGKAIVKRVIAVGGQTVDIDYDAGTVAVDGQVLDEPYIHEAMLCPTYENQTHIEVPEGSIFVMGDNRNHSSDSRDVTLGTVDERYVLGRAVCVLLPFQNFGMIPEGEQTR